MKLKLTLANVTETGEDDEILYLADQAVQSFGFEVRNLRDEPSAPAEGFASALDRGGPYRVIHLAGGQEISLNVDLGDWVDLSEPGQYRVRALYFPRLRHSAVSLSAEETLELSLLPDSDRRWKDRLEDDVRQALIDRDLDPWGVVSYILDARREERYNRAALYLDLESLSRIVSISSVPQFEDRLLSGVWDALPGLEQPGSEMQLVSAQIFLEEALVRVRVAYEPMGEPYERELLFYLHRPQDYWSVRRIEKIHERSADPETYGRSDLAPQDVVTEMLSAAQRGDWDVVLRYLDLESLVRKLPENRDRWTTQMSATEQHRAMELYRRDLISGTLPDGVKPFTELDQWMIQNVSHSSREGSIIVRNTGDFDSAAGPLTQSALYTFRLENRGGDADRWVVTDYEIVRVE